MKRHRFKKLLIDKIQKGNENGFILVVALVLLVTLTLVGTTAHIVTSTDIKIGGNFRDSAQAFYIAQAGIEHARSVLNSPGSFDSALAGADNDKNNTSDNGILSFGASAALSGGAYAVKVTDNDDLDGDPWDDADDNAYTSPLQAPSMAVRGLSRF